MMPKRRAKAPPAAKDRRRKPSAPSRQGAVAITPRLLRSWPLPSPAQEGDKEERGRVVVVGGGRGMPGAVILAATAALRAGAGKLQIVTLERHADLIGAAIPEARVYGARETAEGGLDPEVAEKVIELAKSAKSVLIGPGLVDVDATSALMSAVVPSLGSRSSDSSASKDSREGTTLVVDAEPLAWIAAHADALATLEGRAVLTPHAGEAAQLLGIEKDAVLAAQRSLARKAAKKFHAVVALKGAETVVATPDGETYCNHAGNVGLATSGSGDALAGVIAGLCARGAEAVQAATWGVYLHAVAGDVLARKVGPMGFLARELLAEVPSLMAKLAQ